MRRFLLQQPKTLESLVIPKIGEWMAIQAEKLMHMPDEDEDFITRQIEDISRRIHKKVPKIFHDEFVMETIKALTQLMNRTEMVSFSDSNKTLSRVIEKIIELLYSTNITKLKINQSHPILTQMYKTATTKPNMLANITNLEIYDFEDGVTLLLKELHNLKSFRYDNCTKYELKSLADNCKLIEEINLSHSRKLTDKCMDNLTQLPNLKKVTLYNTSVSKKGIETLLLFCNNIEHISINNDKNDNDVIAEALGDIANSRNYDGRKFQLKTFHYASCSSLINLKLIVKMCPSIEKMYLSLCEHPNGYCRSLVGLHHLRKLKLHNISFQFDDLKDVLHENIVVLWLSGCEIDLNALFSINEKCPNLETLYIEHQNYLKSSSEMTTHSFLNERIKVFPWTKLKQLTLSGEPPTQEELIFLLSNCPNVEYIVVKYAIYLNDDILLKVLDGNPMRSLKRLTIWKGKLTMGIDRMIRSCKELEVVECC